MPSLSTYHLTWVSLTLDVGYLLTATTPDLYKKHLHDPDNHDGVITHLEPDILESGP